MLDDYFEYIKSTCEKNDSQVYEHTCNLYMFEKKLIKIENEIKSSSFIKKLLNKEKNEEKNSLIEIIQQINSKINKTKEEQKKLKEDAFIYVRNKLINNSSYINKFEMANKNIEYSSKLFKEFNSINNLAVDSLNNFNNAISETNGYYDKSRLFGKSKLLYDLSISQIKNYLYNALASTSKLNHSIPIVIETINKIDPEIDTKALECSFKKISDNIDILNIDYNKSIDDIARQFNKINNASSVLNSVFILIHNETLKYSKINNDFKDKLNSINNELNVEIIMILRKYGVEMD